MVHEVTLDITANERRLLVAIDEAARRGAELVLFAEAALTGLANVDDPTVDLPLGQAVPGAFTAALAERARRHGLYVGGGMLEREGDALYDSAVLLAPDGDLALHYRRMQPQWHGAGADQAVYRQGEEVRCADTRFGRLLFLICGDLFDDDIVARVRRLRPDYVLFPFARCFREGLDPREEWDRRERAVYCTRAALTGATTLMANYLAGPEVGGGAFGGAMVVSGAGQALAEWPLGQPGVLVVDLP